MKKYGYVYKIKSPSGKIYIGSTMNIKKRMYDYKKGASISQTKIYRSIKKYGIEAHKIDIILKTTLEYRKTAEYHLGIYYNCLAGLNCFLPKKGDAISVSDTTRKKLSIVNTGKKATEETKEKLRKAHIGRIHKPCSQETKDKISFANKGRKPTEFTIQQSKLAAKTRVISYETRKKLSDSKKRIVVSQETKNKLSKIHKGKIISDESKYKMRLAKLGTKRSIESIQKTIDTKTKKGLHPKVTTNHPMIMSKKKLILNTQTGIFYNSAVEAGQTLTNIPESYFRCMMCGTNTNKTSFIYV